MDVAASEELESIKQAILDTVNANEIYLFGSHVYGMPHKDSDFCLLQVKFPHFCKYFSSPLGGEFSS